MKVKPYRYVRPREPARLYVPTLCPPAHYIAAFDRLNNLKPGVAFIVGGVRYDCL